MVIGMSSDTEFAGVLWDGDLDEYLVPTRLHITIHEYDELLNLGVLVRSTIYIRERNTAFGYQLASSYASISISDNESLISYLRVAWPKSAATMLSNRR